MGHRLHADGGRPVYAWCTLDPFPIVPLIERPATVESKDPVTGEPVTMRVTPSGTSCATSGPGSQLSAGPSDAMASSACQRPTPTRSASSLGAISAANRASSPIDKLAPRVIMASRGQLTGVSRAGTMPEPPSGRCSESVAPLCPSAQPETEGAAVFGVVGGTSSEPRVGYLSATIPVTDQVVRLAASVKPTKVFRIAAPCALTKCQQVVTENWSAAPNVVRAAQGRLEQPL